MRYRSLTWNEKYRLRVEKACKVWEKEKEWHRIFAFLPVQISPIERVWLEWVWRRIKNAEWHNPQQSMRDYHQRTYKYCLTEGDKNEDS